MYYVFQVVIKSSYFQELLQLFLSKFFRWSVADGQSKDSGLSYVNTSELVSILLKDYNKNTLPVRDKKPLEVSIQMFIEDMIPLEKSNMVRKNNRNILNLTNINTKPYHFSAMLQTCVFSLYLQALIIENKKEVHNKRNCAHTSEITLRHGCCLVNLLHIFRASFVLNTLGGLLQTKVNYRVTLQLTVMFIHLQIIK